MLLAIAISYGIASRNIMSNMLPNFYKKDCFKTGIQSNVNKIAGIIIDMDSLSIIIAVRNKKVVLTTKLSWKEVETLNHKDEQQE